MALVQAPTQNARLLAWVDEMVELCQPDDVHWFDGSDAEHELLCKQLVDAGTFTELDPAKRPGSFWAHSDPSDVARVEDRTFICSADEVDAGPTNNWRDPAEMRAKLDELFRGSCAAAPCTWCRSAWARSARRSPTSASRSPTRPTSR